MWTEPGDKLTIQNRFPLLVSPSSSKVPTAGFRRCTLIGELLLRLHIRPYGGTANAFEPVAGGKPDALEVAAELAATAGRVRRWKLEAQKYSHSSKSDLDILFRLDMISIK